MHGFAINCNPDMSWFTRIVPCGIDDAGVSCLTWELGREVSVAEVLPIVERRLAQSDLPGVRTAQRTSGTG
jgi:lipoyl(octanoyl) transferase